MSKVNEEKEQKMKLRENQLAALNHHMNAMESTLTTVKEGLGAGNAPLLFCIDELRETAQRPLLADPKQELVGEIDVLTHLGNLRFKVWSKMKEIVSERQCS